MLFVVYGAEMDADALAAQEPALTISFRKGQPRFRKSPEKGIHPDSKLAHRFSHPGWGEFSRQLSEATAYLRDSGDRIRAITAFPGVDSTGIDFAIDHCEGTDPALQVMPDESLLTLISADFIAAAGELGIFADFSHYSYRTDERSERTELRDRLAIDAPLDSLAAAMEGRSLPPYEERESGISFPVSDAGEDRLDDQIEDARRFLEQWGEPVRALTGLSPQGANLELIGQFRNRLINSVTLPPSFLQAAAKAGIGVRLILRPVLEMPA